MFFKCFFIIGLNSIFQNIHSAQPNPLSSTIIINLNIISFDRNDEEHKFDYLTSEQGTTVWLAL